MYLQSFGDWALLAPRIALGIIFFVHGKQKWGMWRAQPSPEMSSGMLNVMRFLSIMEPLGAIAVISGFLTQFAALGLALVMMGAIWFKIRIWKVGFTGVNGWELDFMNISTCILLIIVGAGNVSLDRLLFNL